MAIKKIEPGSTIGIVSPASPESPIKIEAGINSLKSIGFNVKLGKHVYHRNKYLAGLDKHRAQDLMDMFEDTNVDMILCTRGGYGSIRILPYININIIKNNPKIFMGYSDITILLNYFYHKCNLITFHGPMLTSNWKDKQTLNSFINTLNFKRNSLCLNNRNFKTTSLVHGKTEGTLVGGNLSLICSSLNTPYEIDTENKILFIEEVDEAPYRIDRMLMQLKLSGKLENCSGFILGQFTNCIPSEGKDSFTIEEIINDIIIPYNKPTLLNFMSGHSYPNLTIPIGGKIFLDCNNQNIIFK